MKKLFFLILILIFVGCNTKVEKEYVKIELQSNKLKEGDFIQSIYTCDGDDISPPLQWSNTPKDTKSFCIVMDDPDAPGGTFTHWIIFNIPKDYHFLEENLPKELELKDGIKQGRNDFNLIGYNGPCPPKGSTHHYRFTIYALNEILDLEGGIDIKKLMKNIENHIIGKGELICLYKH